MDFKFKKSLGQNFLKDNVIVEKIVDSSEVDKETLVIEIGPGAGILSRQLASKCGFLLCYEIDTRLSTYLDVVASEYGNIKIIYQDFMQTNIKKDIESYNYDKIYVVSNLPYYITTPIINKLIDDNINPDKIIIMIQKEVANRFIAKPKSREYNSLTVFLNYHYEISKLFDVSKNEFIPKPKVDSSVVCMTKKDNKLEVNNIDLFYKLVRDSFKHKRKNLRNNLYDYDLDVILDVLKKYNLDLTVRAEELTLEQFVKLSNKLSK